MARREIVVLTDDLDGSDTDITTVRFGFEGHHYEIDLGPHHQKQLAEVLAPFLAAARLTPRAAQKPLETRGPAYNAAARQWLKANGYASDVTGRGRIAAHLLAAYSGRTRKP